MKKFLLLAAASLAVCASNAAGFNGNLVATIDDKVIEEGAVIGISDYEDFESIVPGMGYNYVANIILENKTGNQIKTGIKISYTDHPTQAMAEADPAAWGGLQLCVFNAAEGDNCLPVLEMEKSVKANSTMTWQFDNTSVNPDKQEKDRKYHVVLDAEGTTLSFDILFNPGGNGVSETVTEYGEAEYYNLQGQRVLNPEKGLYIVKQNGKTKKMMVR